MIKALIVEDEKIHVETLKNELKNFHDIEVIGIAEDVDQFEEKIISLKPDLAFLDIILHQENSLDRLNKMINEDKIEKPPFVIITTAYDSDQFRRKAQDGYTDAFLNKPIDFQELKKAINFIKKKIHTHTPPHEYINHMMPTKNKIKLKAQAGEFIYLDINDFLYAKSSGNFSEVYLKNHEGYELVSGNLGWLLGELEAYGKIKRLSRFLIINLENIFRFVFRNRTVEFDTKPITKLKLTDTPAINLRNLLSDD